MAALRSGRLLALGLPDFVLRALRALRPCDPRRCVHDSDCFIYDVVLLGNQRMNEQDDSRSRMRWMFTIMIFDRWMFTNRVAHCPLKLDGHQGYDDCDDYDDYDDFNDFYYFDKYQVCISSSKAGCFTRAAATHGQLEQVTRWSSPGGVGAGPSCHCQEDIMTIMENIFTVHLVICPAWCRRAMTAARTALGGEPVQAAATAQARRRQGARRAFRRGREVGRHASTTSRGPVSILRRCNRWSQVM